MAFGERLSRVNLRYSRVVFFDDLRRARVITGGLVVTSGEFVFFVFCEAFLGEVLVFEGALVGFLGVSGIEGGAAENLANGLSGLWMGAQGRIGHALNDLKLGSGAAVGEDFFVGVGGHNG